MNIPQFAGTFNIYFNPKSPHNNNIKNAVSRLYEDKEISEPKTLLFSTKDIDLAQGIHQFPDHVQIQCLSKHDETVKERLIAIKSTFKDEENTFSSIDYQSKSGQLDLEDPMS